MNLLRFANRTKVEKRGGDHSIAECNHAIGGQFIHYKPKNALEGKSTYPKVTKYGVKDVIIPSRVPVKEPIILANSEYLRLKQEAKIITNEQRQAMIDEAERIKSQKILDSQQRKEMLMKTQKIQSPGKGESEDTEAANKNACLIKRSQDLRIEDDDRVKQANRIFLATKCRAIRKAQLAEKKLIKKELDEENKRLDNLMEQTRLEKVYAEEKKREEAEQKRQKYIKELEQQVREKEMANLLEAEKAEEEARMVKKALIALQKEDEQIQNEKHKKKLKLRDEFLKANEDSKYFKTMEEQEEKMREMRIKEFQRLKLEREEALQKEKEMRRIAEERDKARFLKGHGKDIEMKEMMEEFRNARAEEEKEKEWRENEKKKAALRKGRIEDLKKSRANQIEATRRAQAAALAREEEDYMKVVTAQKKLHDEHLANEKKRKEDKERLRLFLLKQVNEKERERMNFKLEKFEDGKAQRQTVTVKDKCVDEYLKEKINNLRTLNLPDRYIKDIERQLKAIK